MCLRSDIENAINRASAENGSGTPDFILAEFLTDSLAAFDKAVATREAWYGRRAPVAVAGTPDNPGAMLSPNAGVERHAPQTNCGSDEA